MFALKSLPFLPSALLFLLSFFPESKETALIDLTSTEKFLSGNTREYFRRYPVLKLLVDRHLD
jgi:hypothetical protein